MKYKRFAHKIWLIFLLCVLAAAGTACQTKPEQTAVQTAIPTTLQTSAPADTAQPAPSATPDMIPDSAACEKLLSDALWQALRESAPLLTGALAPDDEEKYGAAFLYEHRALFIEHLDAQKRASYDAAQAALKSLDSMLPEAWRINAVTELWGDGPNPPSWQYLATVCYPYLKAGAPKQAREAWLELYDLDVRVTFVEDTRQIDCKLTVSVPGFVEYAIQAYPDDGDFMPQIFTYAYINTLYDSEGGQRAAVEPEELGNLLDLTNPLPGRSFRDTWFADRDGGARRHTGLDIKAPEGTDILSCTGGTVLHAGTLSGTGNYVVVLDEYGYQYHYYHMVEPSRHVTPGQTVTAGQVIGNVGNTGNSSANHLHLTIITPDGRYINPYDYLKKGANGDIGFMPPPRA